MGWSDFFSGWSGSNATTKNTTSTNTSGAQPWAQNLYARAQQTADTPYNHGADRHVADLDELQRRSHQNVMGGISQPYINQAAQYATAGSSPITAQSIQNYTNPWQEQVVNSTMAKFARQNAEQMSAGVGSARMAGSQGGDREAVTKALMARAQSDSQSPIIAQMYSQGHLSALGAAQNDAMRAQQGAGIFGNLGQLAYTDTNAMNQYGGYRQAWNQAGLDAASANAAAQSAHPFQTQQWQANMMNAAAQYMPTSQSQTGTQQGPTPNMWSQVAGAAVAVAPYLSMAAGGAVPGGGIGMGMSGPDVSPAVAAPQVGWGRPAPDVTGGWGQPPSPVPGSMGQLGIGAQNAFSSPADAAPAWAAPQVANGMGAFGGGAGVANPIAFGSAGLGPVGSGIGAMPTLADPRPAMQSPAVQPQQAPSGQPQAWGGPFNVPTPAMPDPRPAWQANMMSAAKQYMPPAQTGTQQPQQSSWNHALGWNPWARIMGGWNQRAGGGGIYSGGSYVPQFQGAPGGSGQQRPQMPFDQPPGQDQQPKQQKSFTDHLKEIQDASNSTTKAIDAFRSPRAPEVSTTPNVHGGWGTSTTTTPSTVEQFGHGVQNTFSGIGDTLGSFGTQAAEGASALGTGIAEGAGTLGAGFAEGAAGLGAGLAEAGAAGAAGLGTLGAGIAEGAALAGTGIAAALAPFMFVRNGGAVPRAYAGGGGIDAPPGVTLYDDSPSSRLFSDDVVRDAWDQRPSGIGAVEPNSNVVRFSPRRQGLPQEPDAGPGIMQAREPALAARQSYQPEAQQRERVAPSGVQNFDPLYGYQPDQPAPQVDVPERPPGVGVAHGPPPIAPPQQPAPNRSPTGGIAAAQPQAPSGIWDSVRGWLQAPGRPEFLMAAGSAMMANSGQGGPRTFGIHVGQGLQAGIAAENQHIAAERQAKLENAKLDLQRRAASINDAAEGRAAAMGPYQIQAAQDARAAAASAAAQYKNMTPDQRRAIAPSLGMTAGSPAFNKFLEDGTYTAPESQVKWQSLAEGATLVGVNQSTGREVARIAGNPRDKSNEKFDEALATGQATMLREAVTQGNNQNAAMSDINRLRELSASIGQPGVGNTLTRVLGPMLRSVGLAPEGLSDMEAFTALMSRLVPAQRQPGSGTMSDRDVELFRSSLPQIASTVEGRTFILNQMEAIAKYDLERANIARDAITRKITRTQAEERLGALPDPMEMFRIKKAAEDGRLPPYEAVMQLRGNPREEAEFERHFAPHYGAGVARRALGRN